MLTSLVLHITPVEAVVLPRDLGRASHSLFLRLLASYDPVMTRALHESGDLKPFTCSNVFGGKHKEGELIANPGDQLWVRYTGLSAAVSNGLKELAARYAAGATATVEIDEVQFRVISATLDTSVDRRAGNTSYELMSAPYLLSREHPATRIELKFISPTAFKARGQNLPLPLPGSVFGSLMDKWNAFAPIALPDDLRRFAEECLAISQFTGRTRMLRGKAGNVQIGFVGRVRYAATNNDRYWLSLINVLADFAWYAGIGRLTTQGMGQARRITDDNPQAVPPGE